jgi:hypothetical protein
MNDGIPLGPAYAWQNDSGQWWYTPLKAVAPTDAVEVERASVDGQIVLWWKRGGTDGNLFIRDARQVN